MPAASRRSAFGILAILFLVQTEMISAEPLEVGDKPYYRFGGHLEILRTEAGGMSLSDVMADTAHWVLSQEDEPIIGFVSAAYWARFQITPMTDNPLLLVFMYANLNHVDLYVIHPDGRRQQFSSGDHIPFGSRSIAHRYPIFTLPAARGETVWCYMEQRNAQGIVFPLYVFDEAAYYMLSGNEQLVIGFFIGIFLLVMLFNLLFFFATTDRAYLYYVLFVLFYLLFELAVRDIGGQYIWPRNTWMDDPILVSSAAAAILASILFTISFLQTKKHVPWMHRILNVLLALSIADFLGTFFLPYPLMVQLTNALLLVVAIIFIPNAILVLRRGFIAARFYLAAWSALLVGGFIYGLLNFAVLPSNFFTSNAMTFGAGIQVILLTLAVVDRILTLRRDREIMQKERLDAIEKRLYSDTLTDLPNRNRLVADLAPNDSMTVALVNIDEFKAINDYFGQKAGDLVIAELGRRIQAVVEEYGGKVYRLHADEFACVIRDTLDETRLETLGRALVDRCRGLPYVYQNETLRLEVSVGLAMSAERRLEKADMALSASRSKKTHVVFQPKLETIKRYADNLHWLHIVRESIEQDRIIPFFQPILDNKSGAIRKHESLMRIRAANGSIIGPASFLTIAKKSKMYPELSRTIIRKTVDLMGGTDSEVSINIAVEDIMNTDVLAVIRSAVSRKSIGSRLIFEILETEGIENYEEVSRFIVEMKSYGCRIAIDDFGTGYSSFEHILKLGVDYLKLAGELIKHIDTETNARHIVETVVGFARKLSIQTVAEFVHCESVQNIVREIGVDFSQGYFIAEPGPRMLDVTSG